MEYLGGSLLITGLLPLYLGLKYRGYAEKATYAIDRGINVRNEGLVALSGTAVSSCITVDNDPCALYQMRQCRDIEESTKKTKKKGVAVEKERSTGWFSRSKGKAESVTETHDWEKKRITDFYDDLKGAPLQVSIVSADGGTFVVEIADTKLLTKLLACVKQTRHRVDKQSEAGSARRTLANIDEEWGLKTGASIHLIGTAKASLSTADATSTDPETGIITPTYVIEHADELDMQISTSEKPDKMRNNIVLKSAYSLALGAILTGCGVLVLARKAKDLIDVMPKTP
jgi:hypothetical protein